MSPPTIPPDARMNEAQMLAAVVDTAASVMVGLRPDRTIFLWNRAAELLYQTPRDEALGTHYVNRFIVPEHREAVEHDITSVLAGKQTWNFEDDSILPDGTRRTLLWNVTRVAAPDGEPFGILAIGQDISERKEAEERFRVLFEHVQDGLLLADHTGVLDCNPEALRILGLRKEELLGRRPAEFSPEFQPDGQPSEEKSRALGRETAARGRHRFEWVHRRPDGTDVPVEVSVQHAMLAGRRISVVSWHDLSSRKALEHEQALVQERLQIAQKLEAVGQLAGGVAHDFNNLLTAVRHSVELAREDLPDSSPVRMDLATALEAVDRAAGLTRQLLAYSRRETARPRRTNLVDVARDTLRFLRSSIPTTIVVREWLEGPAPVLADRSQLEQVVMNLLLNARDALPDGGTLELRVERDDAARRARLVVRDDGLGMDEETRRRMFEPFFTTKRVGAGTGLGLAVVYGVVAEAGGEIRVTSTPGAGTTFEVLLPLDQGVEAATDGREPAAAEQPRVVLLVEDDPVVRYSTERLLARLGWRVIGAEDGEAGWEAYRARAEVITLVMTDVRMPRLDGLALARRIREVDPGCPILVFSGYDHVDGTTAAALSNIAFLPKPFAMEALGMAIEEALQAVEAR